ncbi:MULTISPECIES: AbiEi antitoxin N-terminal domain-containing protein [Bradyrhizobium]|uniref:AbiEi antitoxin N-terminal domain-containing protein n=1 Tax=Bradyrhizobium elkanii TaxID=29448 RepID=UPI001FDA9534|nr:AbiEi antitoxin N-terminal domain-containing protein [Bradyrhizobium elkanii]
MYCRPNDPPALHPSLVLLQRSFEGLHVGGKSALDWHGIRRYLSQRPVLHVYGWKAGRLPEWFTEHFPAGYHRKRLFKKEPGAQLHVALREPQGRPTRLGAGTRIAGGAKRSRCPAAAAPASRPSACARNSAANLPSPRPASSIRLSCPRAATVPGCHAPVMGSWC